MLQTTALQRGEALLSSLTFRPDFFDNQITLCECDSKNLLLNSRSEICYNLLFSTSCLQLRCSCAEATDFRCNTHSVGRMWLAQFQYETYAPESSEKLGKCAGAVKTCELTKPFTVLIFAEPSRCKREIYLRVLFFLAQGSFYARPVIRILCSLTWEAVGGIKSTSFRTCLNIQSTNFGANTRNLTSGFIPSTLTFAGHVNTHMSFISGNHKDAHERSITRHKFPYIEVEVDRLICVGLVQWWMTVAEGETPLMLKAGYDGCDPLLYNWRCWNVVGLSFFQDIEPQVTEILCPISLLR
ncbi:hypothetical protein J6590_049523 [Homalodisca vitripennis]|nr:hypothetical protein J6590_049523 [Homalodisca vitripennis]